MKSTHWVDLAALQQIYMNIGQIHWTIHKGDIAVILVDDSKIFLDVIQF